MVHYFKFEQDNSHIECKTVTSQQKSVYCEPYKESAIFQNRILGFILGSFEPHKILHCKLQIITHVSLE